MEGDHEGDEPLAAGQGTHAVAGRRGSKRYAMGRMTVQGIRGELVAPSLGSMAAPPTLGPRAQTWSGPGATPEPPPDQETGAPPAPPVPTPGPLDVLASAAFLGGGSHGAPSPPASGKRCKWYGGTAPMVIDERFSYVPDAASSTSEASARMREPSCSTSVEQTAHLIADHCCPAHASKPDPGASSQSAIEPEQGLLDPAMGGPCAQCVPGAPVAPCAPPGAPAFSSTSSAGAPDALGGPSGSSAPSVLGTLHRPCSACRAAKVLCNREHPCSRCRRLKQGHLCQPPPTVQRGRPSHHSRLLQLRNHNQADLEAPAAPEDSIAGVPPSAASSSQAASSIAAAEQAAEPAATGAITVQPDGACLPAVTAAANISNESSPASARPLPSTPAAPPSAAQAAALPSAQSGTAATIEAMTWNWKLPDVHPHPAAALQATSQPQVPHAFVSGSAPPLLGGPHGSGALSTMPPTPMLPGAMAHRVATPCATSHATPQPAEGTSSEVASGRPSHAPSPVPSYLSCSSAEAHPTDLPAQPLDVVAQQALGQAHQAQRQVEALRAQLLKLGVQPCV